MDYCCAKGISEDRNRKRGNNERKKQRSSGDAGEKKSGHLLCARDAIQVRGMYSFWRRRGKLQVLLERRD